MHQETYRRLLGKARAEGSDRRRAVRWAQQLPIQLILGRLDWSAEVQDLNAQGLRFEVRGILPPEFSPGQWLQVTLPQFRDESVQAKLVWVRQHEPGGWSGAVLFAKKSQTWVQLLLGAESRSDIPQNRSALRVEVDCPVIARLEDLEWTMQLLDLSVQGARLQSPQALEAGQWILLNLFEVSVQAEVRRVIWLKDVCQVGVRFFSDPQQTTGLKDLVVQLMSREVAQE